ncbi:hypothetical protein LCGC14_0909360 [marine sediment metagenome]|uniref:Uncharacterized protein n=1 Tax=marine sediment metagenome TaxID=412755 RepID=A0A0F9NYS6_9ZZZZ
MTNHLDTKNLSVTSMLMREPDLYGQVRVETSSRVFAKAHKRLWCAVAQPVYGAVVTRIRQRDPIG